jgi:hypothetical protein
MDGLARARRAVGLAGMSVRWGAWGEVGMATSAVVQRSLEQSGHGALPPAMGIACLEMLLGHTSSSLAAVVPADPCVAVFNWPKLLGRMARPQVMLSRIEAEQTQAQAQSQKKQPQQQQ